MRSRLTHQFLFTLVPIFSINRAQIGTKPVLERSQQDRFFSWDNTEYIFNGKNMRRVTTKAPPKWERAKVRRQAKKLALAS